MLHWDFWQKEAFTAWGRGSAPCQALGATALLRARALAASTASRGFAPFRPTLKPLAHIMLCPAAPLSPFARDIDLG